MRHLVSLTPFLSSGFWRPPCLPNVIVRAMGTVPPAETVSHQSGDAPESTDFANYFCTYAFLYHQARLESHIGKV